jgi:uncharacterized protein YggU (UPF0235/DUF167 family)
VKISVKAKTSAKVEKIQKIDESHFVVAVKAAPIDGRANIAIAKALASYWGVTQARVKLVSGKTSKMKVFEIL